MEVLEHIAKQTDKISDDVVSVKEDCAEMKAKMSFIEEAVKESKLHISNHHDRITKTENWISAAKLIITKLGALGAFLLGTWGGWKLLFK